MQNNFCLVTRDFWPSPGGIQSWAKSLWDGGLSTIALENPRFPFPKDGEHPAGIEIYPAKNRLSDLVWLWSRSRRSLRIPIAMQVSSGGLVAKFSGKDYGVIVHGNEILRPLDKPYHRRLVQKILKDARVVFCNSRYTLKLVHYFYGGEIRAVVMHPRIRKELHPFLNSWNGKDSKELLLVGSLLPRKGHKFALELLEKLPKEFTLHVMGTGDEQDWQKLRGNSRVRLTSKPSDFQIWSAMQASRAFLMTSQSSVAARDVEGFGIVVLEAGVMGLPVLAYGGGGVDETPAKICGADFDRWVQEILTPTKNPMSPQQVWERFGPSGSLEEIKTLWDSIR